MFITLYTFCSMYALWIMYLSVMNLKGARDAGKLTKWGYAFGWPLLVVGESLDVLINLLPTSVLLLELPIWGEWTVSARMSRHIHDGDGFRKAIAVWLGANLLDPFDPSGRHLR